MDTEDTEWRKEIHIQYKRPLLALGIESLSHQIEKCLSQQIDKLNDVSSTQDKLEQSLTLQASGSDELDNSDYPDSNADEGNNQSDNKGNFANTLNQKRKLQEIIAKFDALEKDLQKKDGKHRKGTVPWFGIDDRVAQNPGSESSE